MSCVVLPTAALSVGARGATLQAASDLGIRGLVVAPRGHRETLAFREWLDPWLIVTDSGRTYPLSRAPRFFLPTSRSHGCSRRAVHESFSDRNAWQQQMPEREAHQRLQGDTTDLGAGRREQTRFFRRPLAGCGEYYSPASASPSGPRVSYLGDRLHPLGRLCCLHATPEVRAPNV